MSDMIDPPSMGIRPMRTTDLDEVEAIEQLSNPHPWTSGQFLAEFDNRCSSIDLLCIDGAVAAFLCSWLVADELQIQNVATHPGYRRQGVAGRILSRRFALAREAGAVVALLEVRAGNSGAIRLYEHLGFSQSGRRAGYYADGEDAVLMERDLTAL